jgi:hypothetical protein
MPAECSLNRPETDQPTTRPDVAVARRAALQWGVLSTQELRDCGLSLDAIGVRVRNGRLHPLHRGVYAVGHANIPLEGHFLAAVKASDGVLSHYSAATLYGLVTWDHRYPEVITTAKRAHTGIRAHRSSMLEVQDVTRHKGIPITTPARTLVDLAGQLNYRPLRRAVREAQRIARHHPAARRHPGPPRPQTRHRQPDEDPRHRPRTNEKRARRHRPRPHRQSGVSTSCHQQADPTPRAHHRPRLPLARREADDRVRRRRMARRPPHPRGRRRAAGHPRGPRRARPPHHVGPSRGAEKADAEPHPRRGSTHLNSSPR